MTIHEDPEQKSAVVLHNLANFAGKYVLEIGCGEGRLTWDYAFNAAHVTAIDPNEERIEGAIDKTPTALQDRVHFLATDMEGYSHPPGQPLFDIAIFGWSL